MKTKIILLALVWFAAGFVWAGIVEGGIFRRGPMLPWRHQQWEEPDEPDQDNPSPFVDPVLLQRSPSPEEIELEELKKKAEKLEEEAKEEAEVSAADPNNKLPFSLPIWLPVAAGGLGLAGAGAKRVKDKIGSIVSE